MMKNKGKDSTVDVDSILKRLVSVKGKKGVKEVKLKQKEIIGLCAAAR